ncbi:hypothetical protein CN918_29300 [Priestia megaterium]|nr:hypothetical protein CN918_29300 [Priestia megaterium]
MKGKASILRQGSAYSIYFSASNNYHSGIKPDKTYGILEFSHVEAAVQECKEYGIKIGYISKY